jgi:lysophospholipase L1-like esterase
MFANALRGRGEVNIVAIGSSSTEGDGASGPAASYPSRLGVALAARFPAPKINVLNLGVGGQEAPDEAARFKKDVLAKQPALVIWQVGTNAAWKDYFLDDVRVAILRGLDHLSGASADVVLMNLQFAPALLDQQETPTPATHQMLDIIAAIAKDSGIALFRRFEIMRHWHVDGGIPFDQMISNFDGNWLHQNDWSYNCIAQFRTEQLWPLGDAGMGRAFILVGKLIIEAGRRLTTARGAMTRQNIWQLQSGIK